MKRKDGNNEVPMSMLPIIGTRTLTGIKKRKKKKDHIFTFSRILLIYQINILMYDAHISIERSSDAESSLRKHFFPLLKV